MQLTDFIKYEKLINFENTCTLHANIGLWNDKT